VVAVLGARHVGFVELIHWSEQDLESRVQLLPPGSLTMRFSVTDSSPPGIRTLNGLEPSLFFKTSLLQIKQQVRQDGDRIELHWPVIPVATYSIRAPGSKEWSPVRVEGGRETVLDWTR
jgi:hypothetical protein